MDDASALRAALDEHSGMVFALAYRLVSDRALAEEVAQDVFLELWKARAPFATPEHLRFWLRRVAVHRASDALRRRRMQPECWASELPELAGAEREQLPGALQDRLGGMLGSLPEAMQVALVLRYGEDEMRPEEIAGLLGQPVATVKSNLARGLRLLRRKAHGVGGARFARRLAERRTVCRD